MLISATALLFTAISPALPTDITPASLAVRPGVIELTDAPYDWTVQQGPATTGTKLALTGNCYTHTATNNNDQTGDCGLD